MNIRIFNICLLLGWLMVTGGTALAVNPGWGLVTGGALLLVLTLAAAYLAGWEQPKPPADGRGEAA
jgi:hypothetical protein